MIQKIKAIAKQIIHYPKLGLEETNYDDYWKAIRGKKIGKYINNYQLKRAEYIKQFLKGNDILLDIGSGDGAVLLFLQRNSDLKIYATDLSDYALEHLNNIGFETIKFDINNFKDIEKLPKVDYITILEVLEHMQNPEKFLKLIMKKAKKGVFFSFPNSGYISYRLRLMFGSFPMQWRVHPGEHLRFWTYRDLKWWLKELELYDKSEVYVYEGIPVLNRLWKGLFSEGFIVKVDV